MERGGIGRCGCALQRALLRVAIAPRPVVVVAKHIVAGESTPVVVAQTGEAEAETGVADAPREDRVGEIIVVDGHVEVAVLRISEVEHSIAHLPIEEVVLILIGAGAIEVNLLAYPAARPIVVVLKKEVGIGSFKGDGFSRNGMDGGVVHPEVALPLTGDDVGALTVAVASTRIVGVVGVVRVIDIDFAGCQREQSSNEQEECEEGRKGSFHDFPVLSDRSVAFVVIVTIVALLSH